MKKILPLTIMLLLLFSIVAQAEFVGYSNGNPSSMNIHIRQAYLRSNGAIDPPTLPIQRVGDTYTLVDNIVNYTLEIQRSGIVFDGANFTLQGASPMKFNGLYLSSVDNVVIKNLKINMFDDGILLNNTCYINITNVRVDASYGIYLEGADYSTISGNTLSGRGYSIYGSGTDSVISYNYFERHGIWLFSSSHTNVTNNVFKDQNMVSIQLGQDNQPCHDISISYNTILDDNASGVPSGIGIFGGSHHNTVFKNYVLGIHMDFPSANVMLSNAYDNVFFENSFVNGQNGVLLDSYEVSMAAIDAVKLSVNNTFYRNNFINNSQAVQTNNNASVNLWDNGSVGNYWSDYTIKCPNATAVNNTAIADTPYWLGVNNTDNYPLLNQVELVFPTDLPSVIAPPETLPMNEPEIESTSPPTPTTNPTIMPATPSPTTATPTATLNAPINTDFISNNFLWIVLLISGICVVLALIFVVNHKSGKSRVNPPNGVFS
jgi:parallel beta-helix repeat protein